MVGNASRNSVSVASGRASDQRRQSLLFTDGEDASPKLRLLPWRERPGLSPPLDQPVHPCATDVVLRRDRIGVQPASHASRTRFRKSIEYGAMAPPATEVPWRPYTYKVKTL